MLGRILGFALLVLLNAVTIQATHGRAGEILTPQKLIDYGQINDDLKSAWNRKCMFHQTRECAEERSQIVWEPTFYNISGSIRCKVTYVENATRMEHVVDYSYATRVVNLDIPKMLVCKTDAGNRIHIDAQNDGCDGPFGIDPLAPDHGSSPSETPKKNLHLCVKQPVYVDDIITVETSAALVDTGPGEGSGNIDEHTLVQLFMGGEHGAPVTVKVQK